MPNVLSVIGHDVVVATSKAVHFVEDTFGGGNGPAKKAAVLAIVAGLLSSVGQAKITPAITDKIGTLIDDIVRVANILGGFSTTAAPVPSAAAKPKVTPIS